MRYSQLCKKFPIQTYEGKKHRLSCYNWLIIIAILHGAGSKLHGGTKLHD